MAIPLNDILADPVKRESLERRFRKKVRDGGPKACWPWTAKAAHVFGYGYINCGRGNLYSAHRVAYALHHGGVPEGAYVLHSCDNPRCCNPNHLRLGTQADNAEDVKRRGRLKGRTGPVDPKLCARKLNAEKARAIKQSSLSKRDLAKRFGVTEHTVANIRSGRTWRNV